jgi:Glycosyl transferase family 2
VAVEHVAGAIATLREQVDGLERTLEALATRTLAEHERAMQAMRMVRDDDARAREKLWKLRGSSAYGSAFDDAEPLVTIIITTYNNWRLLRERALPSVLAQTYERFECLVVGDAAPPEAAQAVRSFGDERLRFVNLPYRGPYPPEPRDAWLISGTAPYNTAVALAAGSWLGSVSDDDALTATCVESLLALARSKRAEVAYGQLNRRDPDRPTTVLGAFPPEFGQWGTQCSLIHAGLSFLPLQPSDWLFDIPNDWSLAERMLRIGVRFAMLEQPVVDYYPSLLWTDRPEPRAF